jgi:probable phosphoglycerate mutase
MAKSNEIRVLLVRTGETEWERAGRMAGATDVPLSENGRAAVRREAEALTDVRLSTIYCGPDEASQVTAHELARATGGKVRVISELGEINLGLWEGLLASELEEKCPRAYRQWMDDPASVLVPEGENLDEARTRIVDTLFRLLDKFGNGAAGIVLRPVALALVICELTGTPTRNLWSIIRTGPATQWRIVFRDALRQSRARVRAGA